MRLFLKVWCELYILSLIKKIEQNKYVKSPKDSQTQLIESVENACS